MEVEAGDRGDAQGASPGRFGYQVFGPAGRAPQSGEHSMTDANWERRAALGLGVAGAAVALGGGRAGAAADSTWDRICGNKALRIGVTSGEPWFYKDPASGRRRSGIGFAAGEAIAAALDVKLVPVETSWGTAVAGVQVDQFDVMFVLDATPQRALAVDFPVQPFFYYAQGLLVRDGLAAARWAELDRPEVRVAVTLGTAPDRDVTARLPHAHISGFRATIRRSWRSSPAMWMRCVCITRRWCRSSTGLGRGRWCCRRRFVRRRPRPGCGGRRTRPGATGWDWRWIFIT